MIAVIVVALVIALYAASAIGGFGGWNNDGRW